MHFRYCSRFCILAGPLTHAISFAVDLGALPATRLLQLMAKDKKREQEDGKQLPPAKKAKTDAKPSAAKLPAKSSTTKPAAKKSAVPKKTDAPKAPPKTGPANVHKSPVKATNAPKAAHQKRASIDADDDDGDQSD